MNPAVQKSQTQAAGAALVLVLWLVAALSLTVLAAARGMRQQVQSVGVGLERARAEAVLDAALELQAQRLVAEKGAPPRYRLEQVALGGYDIQLEVTPSVGLVDVNVASDALLQAFFQRVAKLPAGEATILASRIRDFIDPDDIPSGTGGAEAAQYKAAGAPVMPRNAGLSDLSELRFVLGMTPELYDIIAPYLSINGQQRIAIESAPPALIDALSGQKGLGAQIQNAPPGALSAALTVGAAEEFFTPSGAGAASIFRVRAFLSMDGDRWWMREAWVEPRERPDTLAPWTFLSLESTRRSNKPEQE